MIDALVTIGIVAGALVVFVVVLAACAELVNLPNRRRVQAEMERMEAETIAYCAARRRESEAITAEGDRRMRAWRFEQSWGWKPDSSKPRRSRGVFNDGVKWWLQ